MKRSNPRTDPGGYRSIFVLRLAEHYYQLPGLKERTLQDDDNGDQLLMEPLNLFNGSVDAQYSFTEDFHCMQNWTTPQPTWSGPRLLDVLNLAEPLPAAKYVRVHVGNYVVPLSLAEAEQALLADTLNDQRLSLEYGAPWRIALAGGACFTSVKWGDRTKLSSEPGDNVGERVATTRRRIRLARTAASAMSEEV
ncbi:MAG: molybdopterin-dependent oxidoreductase [Caldilineaceae bacterium]|nr:molybdopterin-dependent oxidoreductase [Caldilineaceae bacterium]